MMGIPGVGVIAINGMIILVLVILVVSMTLLLLLGLFRSARARGRIGDRQAEAFARLAAEETADLEHPASSRPFFVDAASIHAAGAAVQGDADFRAVGVGLRRQGS